MHKFKSLADYMIDMPGIQECKHIRLKRDRKNKNTIIFKMEINYFHSDKSKTYVDIMKKSAKQKITSLTLPAVKTE